jgi:hypothetical protein
MAYIPINPVTVKLSKATDEKDIPSGKELTNRYHTCLGEYRPNHLLKKKRAAFVTLQGHNEQGKKQPTSKNQQQQGQQQGQPQGQPQGRRSRFCNICPKGTTYH